jgi:two-component system, LytTR family, response regulator
MNVIIVDDSILARNELKRLLQPFDSINILGEAENAEIARTLIHEHAPDLIFLDIDMPGESGFDLLESLDVIPQVIFTTGHSEYALHAYDVHAADYLLKPIEADRLQKSIDKVLLYRENRLDNFGGKIDSNDQVFIRDGERCWFVKLKDIEYLETYGNYSFIYFNDKRALVHNSLSYLESRLPAKRFFRANRQYIVNLNLIDDVCLWNSESYRIKLVSGKEIDISRRKSKKFVQLLSF